jgi:1-deoxy-D-xylulose-5-phosphate reductoisomerase
MKRIAILGSTGSIGCSALSVVDAHADRLQVVALAAGGNVARLADQVERHRPDLVAMATPDASRDLRDALRGRGGQEAAIRSGAEGLIEVATHPEADVVLFASAGTAGLDAVLAAIEAGKTIALANKEILVMAGAVVMASARRRGVVVLPVDSEHNAIHQCLHARSTADVRRLVLTASGGPFRTLDASALATVTAADALRHPTWRMGPKITIDSATLMNKGLEVIEARWLFDMPAERIDVVVHPQSVVHSMVELVDGSIIAQLGVTDMRLPIQYAFSYPERWTAPVAPLDLTRCGQLDFEPPDTTRFPCLSLAFRALEGHPGLPVVLNAANEIAVQAFLDGRLGFQDIAPTIERALDAFDAGRQGEIRNLDDIRVIDSWARRQAACTPGEYNEGLAGDQPT